VTKKKRSSQGGWCNRTKKGNIVRGPRGTGPKEGEKKEEGKLLNTKGRSQTTEAGKGREKRLCRVTLRGKREKKALKKEKEAEMWGIWGR